MADPCSTPKNGPGFARGRLLWYSTPVDTLPPWPESLPDPWSQLPGEPTEGWEWARRFWAFGPSRTLARLWAAYLVPAEQVTHLTALAEQWGWLRRAAYVDRERARIRSLEQDTDEVAHARHQGLASRLLTAGELAVDRLLADLAAGDRVSPKTLTELINATVRLDRLVRGDADSREDTSVRVDLGRLSTDDLYALRKLRQKATDDTP